MKKRSLLFVITAIVIVVGTVFIVRNLNKSEDAINNEMLIENNTEVLEEKIEAPTADSLEIDKILGFNPGSNNDELLEEKQGETDTTTDIFSVKVPYEIPGTSLVIESIGQYTGPFVEDGSDVPKANVASIVVKNKSSQLLQYAEINLSVNDEIITFKVSTLPAGTSALVLESTGKFEFNDNDNYRYVDSIYTYLNEASLMENKVEIIKDDKKLAIKNKSNENLGTVYVYYKYVQQGGLYLGGITYRSKFENVEAGATIEVDANHFSKDTSVILMVDYIN